MTQRAATQIPVSVAHPHFFKPNEWNRYEIRCEGKRIRLFINGTQTVDYTEPDPKIPLEGVIAVQIHGGPPSEACL